MNFFWFLAAHGAYKTWRQRESYIHEENGQTIEDAVNFLCLVLVVGFIVLVGGGMFILDKLGWIG